MALVKNQSAPWGEPMFFENPHEEVMFGEVYRQILQQAWKGSMDTLWFRLGKSFRGSRVRQRGIDRGMLFVSQDHVRHCFKDCVAAWHALPWNLPDPGVCDLRHSREWWLGKKHERGLMCSYYDLFMRSCLKWSIPKFCLPPDVYKLEFWNVLTDVIPDTRYPIICTQHCGNIQMVSGEGTYFGPSDLIERTDPIIGEWLSPPGCGSGLLCFADANGAIGSTPWTSWPVTGEPPPLSFDDDNTPDTIVKNTSILFSWLGGLPPFHIITNSIGYDFFGSWLYDTSGHSCFLHCIDGVCGVDFDPYCTIIVTDSCGAQVTFSIRNTLGVWVLKANYTDLKGYTDDWTYAGPNQVQGTLISGFRKQYQLNFRFTSTQYEVCCGDGVMGTRKPCPCASDNTGCAGVLCNHFYFASATPRLTGMGLNYLGFDVDACECYCNNQIMCCYVIEDLKYYEWECP